MEQPTQPIQHCYWVKPGCLLAGEYPRERDSEHLSQAKISALLGAGITIFIDLTSDDDGLLPYSSLISAAAQHLRFPIRDRSIPASRAVTLAILDAIDDCISRGERVYVHCWGGVGRTGVIVGCWLARHGSRGEAALNRLNALWQQCPKSAFRNSPETLEQTEYVRDWNEDHQP